MLAVDLTSLLRRDSPSMSLGGAVSGAAQIVVSSAGGGSGQEAGVALSDGSRIIFASLGSARMLADA